MRLDKKTRLKSCLENQDFIAILLQLGIAPNRSFNQQIKFLIFSILLNEFAITPFSDLLNNTI